MSDLFDATLQAIAKGLDVRARRQAVLASNIANLDTPNYVPRDLDFRAYLQRVVEGAEQGGVTASAAGHLGGDAAAGMADEPQVVERPDRAPGPDGNTVDLDRQMAAATMNAGRYGALSRAAQLKIAALKYVTSNS